MPTRDNVARAAGVSSATVSRVYNSPHLVSDSKREAVLAAARKLGYIPDRNASALRRTGTGTITLLEQPGQVSTRDDRIYRWFYSDVLNGIRRALADSMFNLGHLNCASVRDLKKLPARSLGDGVILYAPQPGLARAMAGRGVPYVCCGQESMPAGINSCHTDNQLGGRAAAGALIASGHCRPAHVGHDLERPGTCRLRWQGFRQGFGDRPIKCVDFGLGIDAGRRAAKKLRPAIEKGKIDCVFVVNDLTAVGVIYGLLDAGVKIPADVSVVGYDNLPFVDTLPVPLATVDIAFGEVYNVAARRLLESITTGVPIHEVISPKFVNGPSMRS